MLQVEVYHSSKIMAPSEGCYNLQNFIKSLSIEFFNQIELKIKFKQVAKIYRKLIRQKN